MKAFRFIILTFLTLYAIESSLEYALKLYKNNQLKNDKVAIKTLVKQANSGDVDAEFLLACAYKNGKLGKIDLDKSFFWYKKAALNGDADAMLMLGWFYYKGSYNIQVNIKKAKYWFNEAASKGLDEAIEMLALLNE
jgi:TPR repeat protein